MPQKVPYELYDYYFPLYNLREPSNNIKVGYATILKFENLPRQLRKQFLAHWELQYGVNNEYEHSKRWFMTERKDCAFFHVEVKTSNWSEAIDQSFELAKASVSILSFLYQGHFPIYDAQFGTGERIKGGYHASHGSSGEYYYRRSLEVFEYDPAYEKEIPKLTEILTEPKSEIDSRIRNALLIFELQTAVIDERVRFVLLATCLESLLMGKADKDYLRWRLAEKSAFLFPANREAIYQRVKKAYDMRSGFIHGSNELITKNDRSNLQAIIASILKRLIELESKGFNSMERIDEHVRKLKFKDQDDL